MGRFDTQIELAQRLIKKNGQIVTLRNYTKNEPQDSDMPWKAGGSSAVDYSIEAVFLSAEKKYMEGEMERLGDQTVYTPSVDTSGQEFVPDISGIILRGEEKWKILEVQPLNPNGQKIMYEIKVRQ